MDMTDSMALTWPGDITHSKGGKILDAFRGWIGEGGVNIVAVKM